MTMINLNDEIYKEVEGLIQNNEVEYPTIKNFVDKAVKILLEKEKRKE